MKKQRGMAFGFRNSAKAVKKTGWIDIFVYLISVRPSTDFTGFPTNRFTNCCNWTLSIHHATAVHTFCVLLKCWLHVCLRALLSHERVCGAANSSATQRIIRYNVYFPRSRSSKTLWRVSPPPVAPQRAIHGLLCCLQSRHFLEQSTLNREAVHSEGE